MDFLSTKGKNVVDESGAVKHLRGTCIGGWMNLEDFINAYPGTTSTLKLHMKSTIGEELSDYFFKRMADYFLQEEDIAYIASLGANCVRLPLNYRDFESDDMPFIYHEAAFERLDQALGWCKKHHVYAILDMHAAAGWQNNHWHSDNERGACMLWHHPHFQERLIRLWECIASRYASHAEVAGYEVLNEPSTGNPNGEHPFDFYGNYKSDWERINSVYKRVTEAIRKVDKNHIIFLEGDNYGRLFAGLAEPFDDKLVYSSHNYIPSGFGPGAYPGYYDSANGPVYWDKNKQRIELMEHPGTKFCEKHQVPLLIGEFGSQYHGSKEELSYRLASMKDQLAAYNEAGLNWTTWTYKDANVMGWVTLSPESEYMRIVEPVQEMKRHLGAENFVAQYWRSPGREKARELSELMRIASMEPSNQPDETAFTFNYAALTGFAAAMLQGSYAKRFVNMKAADLDRVLSSFAFENCNVNSGLEGLLKNVLNKCS